MLSDWTTPLAYGSGLFVALEVLFLVLCRSLPRFRLRVLYHLWALVLGLVLVLAGAYAHLGGQLALAAYAGG